MEWTKISQSTYDTQEWGRRLGECLSGGDIVCLKGDLGAGKTSFAKGVGLALGIEEPMTSPTFTLIQEYNGQKEGESIRLIHMDLYRLRQPEEAEVIGVEDFFQPNALCLIEWPEIAANLLPDEVLDVVIEGSGEAERVIRFLASNELWLQRLKSILNVNESNDWR